MSAGERTFLWQIKATGTLEPIIEHEFDVVGRRKWRFDFAWPERMVAVEVEGGTWTGGRHVKGTGFEADCLKYNRAALLGWKVFRVTTTMVEDGRAIDLIQTALRGES